MVRNSRPDRRGEPDRAEERPGRAVDRQRQRIDGRPSAAGSRPAGWRGRRSSPRRKGSRYRLSRQGERPSLGASSYPRAFKADPTTGGRACRIDLRRGPGQAGPKSAGGTCLQFAIARARFANSLETSMHCVSPACGASLHGPLCRDRSSRLPAQSVMRPMGLCVDIQKKIPFDHEVVTSVRRTGRAAGVVGGDAGECVMSTSTKSRIKLAVAQCAFASAFVFVVAVVAGVF